MEYPNLEEGLCRQTNPDTFNPEKGQWRPTILAKSICARCVVINDCLEYALSQPSIGGVWGGTTEKERGEIRKRGRQKM